MSQDYRRRKVSNSRRKSTTLPVFIREQEENDNGSRLSVSVNLQRRFSTVSQAYLPHGNEYHPQDHVPPSGPESQQSIIVTTIEDEQSIEERKSLSIVSQLFHPLDEESIDLNEKEKLNEKSRQILFFLEPIISGLILFPILVLFWECGWNLTLIFLNRLNQFPSNLHLDEITQEDFESYTWQSLVYPYLVVQFLLLLYYLCQNFIYKYLDKQNWIIRSLLLKFHILGLAVIYIVQWEMLWTIWDQFTPHEWYFEFTLSITSLFALIVFIGHLSDLICAPFLFSYDSIEYCIHFGCPLLTREMKQWKINLINYVLYEIIISNLSIMSWRGFYHYLDDYLYPDDLILSAGICLIIGYILYFPLMYFQTYLEELNIKYQFWTFVSINFPQFYRNIRHLLAFFSCVFLWRGYWVIYDEYVYFYDDYYKNYLIFFLISFFVLCLLQTASSTNGPLSNMEDENNFFPLYPHCYVSRVQRKVSQFLFYKPEIEEEEVEDTKL